MGIGALPLNQSWQRCWARRLKAPHRTGAGRRPLAERMSGFKPMSDFRHRPKRAQLGQSRPHARTTGIGTSAMSSFDGIWPDNGR
jgi:hypothetical protein